jgi:hypothetical protein
MARKFISILLALVLPLLAGGCFYSTVAGFEHPAYNVVAPPPPVVVQPAPMVVAVPQPVVVAPAVYYGYDSYHVGYGGCHDGYFGRRVPYCAPAISTLSLGFGWPGCW